MSAARGCCCCATALGETRVGHSGCRGGARIWGEARIWSEARIWRPAFGTGTIPVGRTGHSQAATPVGAGFASSRAPGELEQCVRSWRKNATCAADSSQLPACSCCSQQSAAARGLVTGSGTARLPHAQRMANWPIRGPAGPSPTLSPTDPVPRSQEVELPSGVPVSEGAAGSSGRQSEQLHSRVRIQKLTRQTTME